MTRYNNTVICHAKPYVNKVSSWFTMLLSNWFTMLFQTGLPCYYQTGLPCYYQTGLPCNYRTGLPCNYRTGLPCNNRTGLPYSWPVTWFWKYRDPVCIYYWFVNPFITDSSTLLCGRRFESEIYAYCTEETRFSTDSEANTSITSRKQFLVIDSKIWIINQRLYGDCRLNLPVSKG